MGLPNGCDEQGIRDFNCSLHMNHLNFKTIHPYLEHKSADFAVQGVMQPAALPADLEYQSLR